LKPSGHEEGNNHDDDAEKQVARVERSETRSGLL